MGNQTDRQLATANTVGRHSRDKNSYAQKMDEPTRAMVSSGRAEWVSGAYREHFQRGECEYRVDDVVITWTRHADDDFVPPRYCPFCGSQAHDLTYRPPERVQPE